MSQVVASRYNTMANSRYAGLGAPSLNQVDLTARQRELRNTIVADALQEYSGMAGIEALPRGAEMGAFVAPPNSFTEASLRSSVADKQLGPMRQKASMGRPAEIAQAEGGIAAGNVRLTYEHQKGRADLQQANALTNEKQAGH